MAAIVQLHIIYDSLAYFKFDFLLMFVSFLQVKKFAVDTRYLYLEDQDIVEM